MNILDLFFPYKEYIFLRTETYSRPVYRYEMGDTTFVDNVTKKIIIGYENVSEDVWVAYHKRTGLPKYKYINEKVSETYQINKL